MCQELLYTVVLTSTNVVWIRNCRRIACGQPAYAVGTG